MTRRLATLVMLLALAGCGGYPQPFAGNPGATARRLAQPPPVRLVVPASPAAMLDDRGTAALSQKVAGALADAEVPAVAGTPRAGDWVLGIAADLQGNAVTPVYTIRDPKGEAQGTVRGATLRARDWAAAAPATLDAAAKTAAPNLVDLLTTIQARIARSDPNSLLNRSAHIYFAGVSGAPGNGNRELTDQMRKQLPIAGELVQNVPDHADFALRGEVRVAPGANKTQRIEIQWIIDDARGERGRVVQLNEVPPGSLDGYWGDVALVITQQASNGIRGVIETNAGKRQAVVEQGSKAGAPPLDPASRASVLHTTGQPLEPGI